MPNRQPSARLTFPPVVRAALLALILAVGVGGFLVARAATFTDQASVPDNTFSTAADFSPPWWDGSYGYRQQITVTTGTNSPFNGYTGYSVQFTTDTATLIDDSKLRADCDDLRIAFWSGSLWTELDRDLYSCDAANTEVWFQLQEDIAASSSAANYYLYYGNASASDPPANRSNVYLHYNDWSTDRLSEYAIGRQDDWHGTGSYTGFTWDSGNERVNFDTSDDSTGGLRLPSFGERDVYVEQLVRYTGCFEADITQGLTARYLGDGTSSDNWYAFVQANSTGCSSGPYTNPVMQKDTRTDGGFCGSGAGSEWALDGSTHRQAFAIWGVNDTNMKGWLDKSPRKPSEAADLACSDASDHENAGDVAWMQAQVTGSFDDFLVRRYTEPEPTISLGGEETAP
jgi:peptidoglycan hydrolase-like protein with peptidoglycan-binding domain